MKILKTALIILAFCAAAYGRTQEAQQPTTEDLGLGVFSNETNPIIVVVDAGVALRKMDSSYLMFTAYLSAKKDNQNIVVQRADVTMIYKDAEYKMPTVKELTSNYNGQVNDFDLNRELNKDTLVTSRMKLFRYPAGNDFYPSPNMKQHVAVDEGSLYGIYGLKTKLYFKNPGIKKGDAILIRVRDKKNPEITGEVVVEFK